MRFQVDCNVIAASAIFILIFQNGVRPAASVLVFDCRRGADHIYRYGAPREVADSGEGDYDEGEE